MLRAIVVLCALGVHFSEGIAVEEPNKSDVLDLAAWVTTWVMAMGAYSGRQERPYRREFEELEDMPEVFIPSELTGNQIERAFRMAGTKQAVPEINELLKYLEFTATREGEPWLLLEDGHFKPTENCIKQLKDLLSTEDLFNGVDEKMKETLVVMSEELKLKEQYEDWDDLSAEINRIFKGITGKLLEAGYIKLNEDGFYTLTKSVTDLVKMMVKDKILAEQRQWRVRDEDNYNEVREFEEYEENIVSAIDSGAAILQLPQDMDWAGIKSSFQAMYKKALPQVQLFQFLTKKLTYIDLDRDSKMYKLSDFLTKNMVDSMHWAFRWTPLGGY